MDGIRDHIFSNIHGQYIMYEMWQVLIDLFQNSSDHRKLALMDKLLNVKMQRIETISQYLGRFIQYCDELGQVGVTIEEEDLVTLPF